MARPIENAVHWETDLSTVFPDQPRDFPYRREVKIALRAAHVLCAGSLLGAYLFGVESARSEPWLLATIVSGLSIVALDLHESAAFLLQVRGVVVTAKILVLVALPWLGGYEAWFLGAVVVASVVSSHASSKVRYRMVVGRGRVKGSETKG